MIFQYPQKNFQDILWIFEKTIKKSGLATKKYVENYFYHLGINDLFGGKLNLF